MFYIAHNNPELDGWYHECPECGKYIPHYEDYCSNSCRDLSFD